MRSTFFSIACLIIFTLSCNKKRTESPSRPISSETSVLIKNKYARGFEIIREDGAVSIKLFSPFRDIEDTIEYIITEENRKFVHSPDEFIINGPVTKVGLMASTHSAFLDKLGRMEIVKAISSRNYFYNQTIQKLVESNEIREVGFAQNFNFEEILLIDPQVIIISGMSSADLNHFSNVIQAGIVMMPMSEWQEEHPLGRAEWIKVFGALTGQLDRSAELFDEIEKKYSSLAKKLDNPTFKPKVIVNAPYKDSWWVPGGKSYMSHLLKDSGTEYHWKDDTNTGGVQADLEAVYYYAHDADYWINPGTSKDLSSLLNFDNRYSEFKSVKTGNVYNNTKRTGNWGGNDYFEKGVVNPDIILADLIKIFHPDKLKDHNLYFYEKLK